MKETKKTFDKTEDDLKALQSMGQIIGEVLRQLDDEKCASLLSPHPQIVPSKTSHVIDVIDDVSSAPTVSVADLERSRPFFPANVDGVVLTLRRVACDAQSS